MNLEILKDRILNIDNLNLYNLSTAITIKNGVNINIGKKETCFFVR